MQDFALGTWAESIATPEAYAQDPALVESHHQRERHQPAFRQHMLSDKGNPVHADVRKAVNLASQRMGLPSRQFENPTSSARRSSCPSSSALSFGAPADHLRTGAEDACYSHELLGRRECLLLAVLTRETSSTFIPPSRRRAEPNPRQMPNFVAWISAAQVAGKPISIAGTWNINRDRFVIALPRRRCLPARVGCSTVRLSYRLGAGAESDPGRRETPAITASCRPRPSCSDLDT
jgi:hypothetical protein